MRMCGLRGLGRPNLVEPMSMLLKSAVAAVIVLQAACQSEDSYYYAPAMYQIDRERACSDGIDEVEAALPDIADFVDEIDVAEILDEMYVAFAYEEYVECGELLREARELIGR